MSFCSISSNIRVSHSQKKWLCFCTFRARFCPSNLRNIIARSELARVASVSVGFESKELRRPVFRAGKTPNIPFLGLSLLSIPTETLATQAIASITPSPFTPALKATITLSKCFFHIESMQRLLSGSLMHENLRVVEQFSQRKPEVFLLHYVTCLNDRMMSLTCVCLT